jgi:hypothetical protein
LKPVQKKASAPRIGEWRGQGCEGLGDGCLDGGRIFKEGLGAVSEFVRDGSAEVKLGVMEAKRLASQCGSAAFPAVGQDMATLNEHRFALLRGGVYIHPGRKISRFNSLAAATPPGLSLH